MSRFDRQIALPEVGAEGQAKLAAAHVLVVGAGGLGSPVLQYLAGAGLGEITVMDGDSVEATNLPRQPLYTPADIGRYKVDAARERLRAMAPELRLHPHARDLTPDNVTAAVTPVDLVIDAADSHAVSYTLSDCCQRLGRDLISASALAQSGYVGVFCGGGPSLRAVFPDPPSSAATCASSGIMGPVVGVIGAWQAQLALKLLLNHQPTPRGRLFSMDFAGLQMGGFDFSTAEEPSRPFPFIGRNAITDEDYVVELRPEQEAPTPAVRAAVRILPEALRASDLPRDRRVVLACHSGLRAWRMAAEIAPEFAGEIVLLAAGRRG
ncbi:putative adenylyltransferase ThiF [Phaeobacter piscinae]|uniref:Adenylyltransferase ThiF n=2 Tax=Phaeobacter piscinae TaxID=1580596 RepID=A0AAN1GPM8_9RHOB|nr:putative adenylyltransferase ThiF [Phaeobacter piscinae]AUR35103.1 putative adenylyltransferase ThiF [Phaeobacter piscinae]